MHRRTFLTSAGATSLLAASGLLGACAGGGGSPIPSGEPSLNVLRASFELLRGEGQRFVFTLTTTENEVVDADEVEVYIGEVDGEIQAGPFTARATDDADLPRPLYRVAVDVEQAGPTSMVVVDGDRYGESVMDVVDPADSALPAPGDAAVPVATPTRGEPGAADELCTRDPDCGMHEESLDAVLDEGRPVMLLFATPAYCQTAVCGPTVDTLEELRSSGSWDDLAFIHCEIYEDAGETVLPAVSEWELPSEPWLFAIGRDGRIQARLDGAMLADELGELAESLNA